MYDLGIIWFVLTEYVEALASKFVPLFVETIRESIPGITPSPEMTSLKCMNHALKGLLFFLKREWELNCLGEETLSWTSVLQRLAPIFPLKATTGVALTSAIQSELASAKITMCRILLSLVGILGEDEKLGGGIWVENVLGFLCGVFSDGTVQFT